MFPDLKVISVRCQAAGWVEIWKNGKEIAMPRRYLQRNRPRHEMRWKNRLPFHGTQRSWIQRNALRRFSRRQRKRQIRTWWLKVPSVKALRDRRVPKFRSSKSPRLRQKTKSLDPPLSNVLTPNLQICVAVLECTIYISALRNLPARAVSHFEISANRKSILWMTTSIIYPTLLQEQQCTL